MRAGDTLVVRVNVVLRVVLSVLAGLFLCAGVLMIGWQFADAQSWTAAIDDAVDRSLLLFIMAGLLTVGVWVTSVVINGQRGHADRMFGFPVRVQPLDTGEAQARSEP